MGIALAKLKAADKPEVLLSTDVDNHDDDILNLQVPANVKNIHIDGLSRTKNELVTKQLERVFDAKTFDSIVSEAHLSKLRLERLGVFSGIQVFIDVADSEDPKDFDVYFLVKELRQISANVGTNVGHNEGNMTVGARINNMRGLAEAIKADVSFGTRVSSSYEIGLVKPLSYNPDKKVALRLLKSVTDLSPSYYKENVKGLGFNLVLPSAIGVHTIGWDFMWRENSILPSAPFDIREQTGHSLKSSIKHSFISDGRDDWIFPSKGHLLKHNIECSVPGGNVDVCRSDLEIQLNKEIFPNVVVAGTLQAGVARSLSSTPVMINDRYFLGGPLSIRGYAMKGIGQHSEQASLGGELYWASGVHLYTPLPFRSGNGGFGDLFRMHFFANAGNISDMNYIRPKDFLTNCRYSYGVGIMFMLGGMARLEVNYCIPKNAQPGDIINEGLQVGVGINFL